MPNLIKDIIEHQRKYSKSVRDEWTEANKKLENIINSIQSNNDMNAPKNNVSEDKSQVSLIPMDLLVPMLEPAYREGIIKYQRESWRMGFKATVMYDALMRHLNKWFFELESFDPEAKEHGIKKHHLGAAIFCLINLYETERNFSLLDDRPLKILEDYKNELEQKSKQREQEERN